jgi:hypothetical protein
VTDEEASLVDDGGEVDDLPDWQAERLPKVREVLGSEDFLPLPSKFDVDEYHIMERFCRQVPDEKIRGDLLFAIRGQGAFGRFKTLVHHCGLVEQWYAFRDGALEDIAAEWLEANGIGYTRDGLAGGSDDS